VKIANNRHFAVRWGRVGRLKLSSVRANSPTGLFSYDFVAR